MAETPQKFWTLVTYSLLRRTVSPQYKTSQTDDRQQTDDTVYQRRDRPKFVVSQLYSLTDRHKISHGNAHEVAGIYWVLKFLADRAIGRAFGTLCRLSVCLSVATFFFFGGGEGTQAPAPKSRPGNIPGTNNSYYYRTCRRRSATNQRHVLHAPAGHVIT